MTTEDLQNLYQTYLGEVPEEIVELPSSGSNRRYFQLTGTQKLIGVYGTSKEENEAFLYIWQHTSARKVFLFQKYTSVLKTRIVICKKI